MTKSKILALSLIVVITLFSIGGCSSGDGQETQEVFKLGLIQPLTGDHADFGLNVKYAVELAVNEINANGGLLDGKYKMELHVEDDGSNPSTAVTAATRLITQTGIGALIGSLPSTCTLAIMDITEDNQIPQIVPASTAPAITEKGNKYVFRNATTDYNLVSSVVAYGADELGFKRFAMIHDTTDYGMGGSEAFKQVAAERSDIEIVGDESYTFGDTDFSVQLTKIEEIAPEGLLVWGNGSSFYLVTQQIQKLGLDTQILGCQGYAINSVFEAIGDDAAGVIFGTPFFLDESNPKTTKFANDFKEISKGWLPDFNSAQGYDAVYIIKNAIEKCGSIDSSEIRDAILELTDIEGMAGTMNFDETGESNKSTNIVKITGGDPSSYRLLK